ncbi:MAG: SH3 domain-containing protein [Devosia sp.]|jgi:hypothetical protein
MRIIAAIGLLAPLLASPARAQMLSFGINANGSGNSTATVTTEQAIPNFDGPFVDATVLSGVNIRSAPNSHGSSVTGQLHEGQTVSVRCKFGWCQLADGGFTAQKFLSLDGSAQSFAVVQPPSPGAVSSGDAPAVNTGPMASTATASANFDGLWTLVDSSGKPGMPLILKQNDRAVTGTLQSPDRLAKLTGEIDGRNLNFTYDMLNKAGRTIASGNGYLTLGKDNASLRGVLMLNGLVVSNVNATR